MARGVAITVYYDSVEILNVSSKSSVEFARKNLSRREEAEGGLVVLVGDIDKFKIIDDIVKICKYRNKYVVYVPGPGGRGHLKEYQERTMYDRHGYRDYGMSHSFTNDSGVFSDVGCFWSNDNEIATVVVPDSPTLAGMNMASTVMRKSDVMISSHPPLELAEGEQSMLVSTAREIWKPKTHIYPEKGKGLILASGSDRIIGLPGKWNSTVLRWTSGDLSRGPINSIEGYPKLKKVTSTRRKRT